MFSGRPFSTGPFSEGPESVVKIYGFSSFYSGLVLGAVSIAGSSSLSLNWDFRRFVATVPFITASGDDLPDQPFEGTLDQSIVFEQSIIGSDFIGKYTSGLGELKILADGTRYDDMVAKNAVAGRRIPIKAGALDSYNNFATIADCIATGWINTEDALIIPLRDKGYKLEVPALSEVYAGTGGIEGTSDMAGKRKPRPFGECHGIEPPLLVPNTLTYDINGYGAVEAILAVTVRAAPLTFGSDHATFADLQAASVSDGSYHTCLAEGKLRLTFANSNELRAVRVNVKGDKSGGVYVDTTAQIVRRLIDSAPALNSDEINEVSFDQVDALQPAPIGYYLGLDDQATIADAAADLMDKVGGWVGDGLGEIEVGIFTSPDDGTAPVEDFNKLHWADETGLDRDNLPAGVDPPPKRFRVAYGREWSPQSDFAGSVANADRAYLAQEYRLASTSDSDAEQIEADYPTAQEPEPILAYFVNEADAQAEADRRLDLYRATRAMYRILLLTRPYLLKIGHVITVTYDRWDLSETRRLRVCKRRIDLENETVEIWGYG